MGTLDRIYERRLIPFERGTDGTRGDIIKWPRNNKKWEHMEKVRAESDALQSQVYIVSVKRRSNWMIRNKRWYRVWNK